MRRSPRFPLLHSIFAAVCAAAARTPGVARPGAAQTTTQSGHPDSILKRRRRSDVDQFDRLDDDRFARSKDRKSLWFLSACSGFRTRIPAQPGTLFPSALLWMLVLALGTNGAATVAQTPGTGIFSNVSDVLNGKRTLLSVQDLYVYTEDTSKGYGNLLSTTNGSVSSTSNFETFFRPQDLKFRSLRARVLPGTADDLVEYTTYSINVTPLNMPSASFGPTLAPNTGPKLMLAADFDQDGLDELIAFSDTNVVVMKGQQNTSSGSSKPTLQTVGPSLGISSFPDAPLSASAVGDFNGDGLPEVALLYGNTLDIYKVDPQTYTITKASSTTLKIVVTPNIVLPRPARRDAAALSWVALVLAGALMVRRRGCTRPSLLVLTVMVSAMGFVGCGTSTSPGTTGPVTDPNNGGEYLSMTAGHFSNATADQIVIAQGPITATDGAVVYGVSVDSTLKPSITSTTQAGVNGPFNGSVTVTRATFDASGLDQVVLMLNTSGDNQRRIQAVTFDTKFNATFRSAVNLNQVNTCISPSIAVGNFNQPIADGSPMPTDQVAIFVYGCGPPMNQQAIIYSVDPGTYSFTQKQVTQVATGSQVPPTSSPLLMAADAQGRSLVLGTPSKFVVEYHRQPSLVMAMPPMHIDFAPPSGETIPTVLNVSGVFNSFNSKYSLSTTTSVQSTTTDTTSWANSIGTDIGGSYTFGSPKTTGLTIAASVAVQSAWNNTVQPMYGTTQGTEQDLQTATSISDEVITKDSRINMFTYPILGDLQCPDATPNCSDDQKQQAFITFSGQDLTSVIAVDGTLTRWYQPPWEPFNILSYPANTQQLLADDPTLSFLSNASQPDSWYTGNLSVIESTKWSNTGNNGLTTGSHQTVSIDSSASVNIIGTEPGIFQGKAHVDVDYEHSNSISKLQNDQTTLSSSTGITISKPTTLRDAKLYDYLVTPLLSGHIKPEIDAKYLNLNTDITTFGALQSNFLVDPHAPSAGFWWNMTYTKPDIALTHPDRWRFTTRQPDGVDHPECLLTQAPGQQLQCASAAAKSSADPLLDDFDTMRGLFIASTSSAPGSSQLANGRYGQPLTFNVRVANYSFAPLPSGTKVYARLYARTVDPGTGSAVAPDYYLGTGSTDDVPPFDSSSARPNWSLIPIPNVSLDAYQGSNLTFWVIVWAEDKNGNLLEELPNHGLASIPPQALTWPQAVALSDSYGNNIGAYDVLFHVYGKDESTQSSAAANTAATGSALTASLVSKANAEDATGTSRVLSVKLNPNYDIGHVSIYFFDGPPSSSAVAFAEADVSGLKAAQSLTLQQAYHFTDCQPHTIYALVAPGRPYATTSTISVQGSCLSK